MLVIKLVGGLASQLHKYAVAKSIAESLNLEVLVDLSFYTESARKKNPIMVYELDKLNISPKIASKKDVAKAKGYGWLLGLFYGATDISFFNRVFYKLESYSFFRKNFMPSAIYADVTARNGFIALGDIKNFNCVYVSGEFGVRFDIIADARMELKESILIKDRTSDFSLYEKKIIESHNPVCMHVRRGDYVWNQRVNSFHGVCGISYYKSSMDYLVDVEDKKVFVFSDDIGWVKANFNSFMPEDTVYIDGNKSYEDFFLMTKCKYHVMANSGFSSIAAWLSGAPDSSIISPKKWFNDPVTNENQLSLLPKEWVYL